MVAFTQAQLVGLNEDHLYELFPNHKVHKAAVDAIKALQQASQQAGFDLRLASSFRSFERQAAIWNKKASGQTPCLDKHEQIIEMADLTAFEQADAICFFSAIPGTSRHHWGCDFDIYDFSAYQAGQSPRLTQSEYASGGKNAALHHWLCQNASRFGFYFPFTPDKNGVCPEPWHISFKAVSQVAQSQYNQSLVIDLLTNQNILLADVMLEHIDYFYSKYIGQYHV